MRSTISVSAEAGRDDNMLPRFRSFRTDLEFHDPVIQTLIRSEKALFL